MAGWKLRKDKASADTPSADPETAVLAEEMPIAVSEQQATRPEEPAFLDTVPGLPDFDADPDLHFSGLEFDREPDAAPHADGPLTLVDYTEPTHDFISEPHAQIYDAPTHDTESDDAPATDTLAYGLPPIIAMPPPADLNGFEANGFFETPHAEDALPETDEDFEPLPAASSWLSADFSAGIPAVAPFVLDTPVPEAPPAAPQLTLRIGRLSAAFDVVKEVTTIGRPDSVLHYYPDVEIEMDDAVSRRHAEIVKRPDGYYIVDTGSTNGTKLNGEMLLPHQEQRLAHGDKIHVGDRTEITFE